jgi:hypothetical protein
LSPEPERPPKSQTYNAGWRMRTGSGALGMGRRV